MTLDLFSVSLEQPAAPALLAPGVVLLQHWATAQAPALLAAIETVLARSPLRQMQTPGGGRMSVRTSNCGALGWVSDAQGYRYSPLDPLSGQPWPGIPATLQALAGQAAQAAGFGDFVADACLINRYEAGARMNLHQDRNEQDFSQPIVSVSLGLPVVFLLGGLGRAERTQRILLEHGDVLVWGGPARLRFHGVLPLKAGEHSLLGPARINLTLRKAG